MNSFQLSQDAFGKLVLTLADGKQFVGVVAVRAFPIHAPDSYVSLLNAEGKEVIFIENLNHLSAAEKTLIEQALQGREFMPEIQRLDSVNSFSTPSTWRVQTNRGETEFVLKGEEDIRRLSTHTLVIADAHGVQYLIRHLPSLDRHTRKLLDRFM
jgi:Domain of unknown function (DUF1854)